jgi:hypothetical protein
MSKVQGTQGTSIQGFINYKLVKKNGTVVAEKHNTITMAFKRWLHNKGAGSLFEGNNWSKGRHFVFDSLVGTQTSNSTYKLNERVYGPWGLTLGLLNLGAQEQSNLDEQSTFINIFDNTNGVNSSKLVGKCSNSVNGAVSTNKGKTQKVDETYLLDGAVNSRQWLFDEGVATGTIDTIAMLPGGMNNEIKIPAGGVRSAVELDDYNRCVSGSFVKGTTSFLPPGIEGFTGPNKIFLNYENADGAQHSYNITTGETDDAPTTFKVPDYPWIDYIVGTNYIYAICQRSTSPEENPSRASVYLYVYNKSDMNVVNYKIVGSYDYTCRLIAISGNVYVQYWDDRNTVKLDKITVDGSSISLDNVSDISTLITIPSVLSDKSYMLGMCNSNYVLYIPQYMNTSGGTDTSSSERASLFTGLVFTNLNDPLGSVIDSIPNLRFNSCLMHNGTNYWVGDIINTYDGSDNYVYASGSEAKFKDLEGMAFAQISDDNGAQFVYNDRGSYDTMFLLSGVGDWTSLFSFVVLDEPITKASSDKLYITYGYKIQGATLTVPIASSVSTISDSGVTSGSSSGGGGVHF